MRRWSSLSGSYACIGQVPLYIQFCRLPLPIRGLSTCDIGADLVGFLVQFPWTGTVVFDRTWEQGATANQVLGHL